MKKKLLIVIVLSSLFLTACGEKNTITYDFKSNKATINLDKDKDNPSINSQMEFFQEIAANCDGGYSCIGAFSQKLAKEGKAETEVCNNGISYKAINYPRVK